MTIIPLNLFETLTSGVAANFSKCKGNLNGQKTKKALDIVKKMEIEAANGNESLRPTYVTYNTAIKCCMFAANHSRSISREVKVEMLRDALTIFEMLNKSSVTPNSYSYDFIFGCIS